ncbi:MAG: SGNH/GDSL hydrolase family protein [Pseudolabrys sp.]
MACRTPRARPQGPARARLIAALAVTALLAASAFARAQDAPDISAPVFSQFCQPGATALAADIVLPNVAAVLTQGRTLRILSFGAAPGRIRARGDYSDVIEGMLERTLGGIDVVMVNRGVSGELATQAAFRMKNEVALNEPDLVLWQVGTNDALAYVPAEDFAAAVRNQIVWLKAHKVDVVLVGLQFASEMQRDTHYRLIRDTLRKVAAEQEVPVIRFYEAMQIIGNPAGRAPAAGEFERSEAGYNCLAQYVARAITLGTFAKTLQRRR